MDINKLYDIAENENIEVVNFSLPTTVSMAHMTDNKDCYVAMDYRITSYNVCYTKLLRYLSCEPWKR